MVLSEIAAPFALGVFFLFAAYLNLNDPDWILWSTAYTVGALVCGWTVASVTSTNKNVTVGAELRRYGVAEELES